VVVSLMFKIQYVIPFHFVFFTVYWVFNGVVCNIKATSTRFIGSMLITGLNVPGNE